MIRSSGSANVLTELAHRRRAAWKLALSTVAVLGMSSHASADATFSLEGSLGAPDEVEVIVFILDEAVSSPQPLVFRTYSDSGSSSAPGGVNHAGDVILSGGFDPVLELVDDLGSVAFIDDGTGIPDNFDSLLTFPDIPSPLPANVYGLGLSVLDADFFGFNPNWAVDLTGPDDVMTLLLPDEIDQIPGLQGISKVTVTGAGSLAVGLEGVDVGNATLNVFNGGELDAGGPVTMAALPGESSLVTVDGPGSILTATFIDVGDGFFRAGGHAQLTVSNDGEVELTEDSMIIESEASVIVDGGTLTVSQVQVETDSLLVLKNAGTLNLTGPDPVIDNGGLLLWSDGSVHILGDASLGNPLLPDATTLNGGQSLNVTGTLTVGPGQIFAVTTTGHFSADTLEVIDGHVVAPALNADLFNTINAQGTIHAEIHSGFGATINAQGPLALGDPSSVDGFDFFGTLNVGSHRVIINDADQAFLAEENNLGPGGSINAVNGALLFETSVLTATGPAVIEGDFQNDGTVNGPFSPGEFLTFDDDLSGSGIFNGNIQALQAFIPGASPGVVVFNDHLALSSFSVVHIEVQAVAGAEPTPGVDHDQVNVTRAVTLDGSIDVSLLGVDLPDIGSEFVVLTYGTRDPGDGLTMFDVIIGSVLDTSLALAPLFTDTDGVPDGQDDALVLRASIPGDVNLDDKVSVADLSTFALNFNTNPGLYVELTDTNAWALGDFNGDGRITVADLSLLALNFGADLSDPANPVSAVGLDLRVAASMIGIDIASLPEPGTGVMALLAVGCIGRGYRYRQHAR